MRLCDFLRHINGEFTVRIFRYADESLIRKDKFSIVAEECRRSFNIFSGFDCELWEMKVRGWNISTNIVNIWVEK